MTPDGGAFVVILALVIVEAMAVAVVVCRVVARVLRRPAEYPDTSRGTAPRPPMARKG